MKNPCVQNSSCVGVRKNDGVEIIHNYQRKRACQDVDVKPVVRDPMDDDRVLVESGAELTPVPHEPSEFEKLKHHLTHIPFQPWCTSCVKGKAQAEPHKRIERIIEDSELPVIQCDYLMLKDTAGTGGLKVLSMCVRTFGYGMSTVVETKGPTDMYATMWTVKMRGFVAAETISVLLMKPLLIVPCPRHRALHHCGDPDPFRTTGQKSADFSNHRVLIDFGR